MSDEKEIYAESMWIDSGAHSLYNQEVLKHKKQIGKNGRVLDKPIAAWGGTDPSTDFSYYDLKKGSKFRQYCDAYAAYIKAKNVEAEAAGRELIWANIDAIGNPELTWKIQQYFEKEHGVRPVPIVHCHTPMKYVDKYLENKYELMGVGGLGQGISRHEYFGWADQFFRHICPESNKYLPIIKTHGFAMTSWELMCRYPWWSVDSATWVKLSAYGWIYIPRWQGDRFRFDKPPLTVNFSFRSPQKEIRDKHYENVPISIRQNADRWMQEIGIGMGWLTKEGKMIQFGLASHHRARSMANLIYLKRLEQSRPEWPHPLDHSIVEPHYKQGEGMML